MGANRLQRLRIVIRGAVHGVGFRPFVYRLAEEMNLKGWVINNTEASSSKRKWSSRYCNSFCERPTISFIQSLDHTYLDPVPCERFEIRPSQDRAKTTLILPDIATCEECRREIFDQQNRRYRYPFTNCTNCGPRFTIVEGLPYDRRRTSMRIFEMCPECAEEYHDPRKRRFHAQPNACSKCGPQMELWDGHVVAHGYESLYRAVIAICDGLIVAVKGLGGFHLMVDSSNDWVVRRLRHRKRREEKPFALMFPSLQTVTKHAQVDPLEEAITLLSGSVNRAASSQQRQGTGGVNRARQSVPRRHVAVLTAAPLVDA